MLTRTIADLTFEVHAPHQYRLVVPPDPQRPGHEVWMTFNGERWHLIYYRSADDHEGTFRAFKSRNEIVSLLTSRRAAI